MYRTFLVGALLSVPGCADVQTAEQLGEFSGTAPGVTCTNNQRPTLIWSGATGDALAEGAPLVLSVSDDRPLSELSVTWTSELDGPQDGPPQVAEDGTLSLPTDMLTPGHQAITVAVEDICGEAALTAIGPCVQGTVHVDQADFNAWRLGVDASVDPATGWLDLTQDAPTQKGSAYDNRTRIPAGEIRVVAEFSLGENGGGDGFTVTAIDPDRQVSWTGGGGCGIGYGTAYDCQTGVPIPGWTVEVDTFANDHDPVDGPHVAFVLDGRMDAPLAWAPIPDVSGLGWHELEVIVSEGLVTVSLDRAQVMQTLVPAEDLDFPAHIGFTAGTGSSFELHRISKAEITHLACVF